MEDILEMNVNGQDDGFKDQVQLTTDAANLDDTSTTLGLKPTPKRIVYDLSDDGKEKQCLKTAAKNRLKIKRSRITKDLSSKLDRLESRSEVVKRRKGRDSKHKLVISTNDLRENIKTKRRGDPPSRIESQVKIEYIHQPAGNTKALESMPLGNGFVKEELKRDILTLKSKLEGVEAKVNNNYYPSKTVTKIECRSNYKLHTKEDIEKHKSYGMVRERHSHDKSKKNLIERSKREEKNLRRGPEKMHRNREIPTVAANRKDQKLRRTRDLEARGKRKSNYDERHREKPNPSKRNEKRRDERTLKKENQKIRSRFPSGDLSKLRSHRLEKETMEMRRNKAKRNRSLSPSRQKKVHHKDDQSIKRQRYRHRSGGSDPGHLAKPKLLPWPQFKSLAEKPASFENGLTLRQDAFGLHPDIHPGQIKHAKDYRTSSDVRKDERRSITPVYDTKFSTPVLVQSPILKEGHAQTSGQADRPLPEKGVNSKMVNFLSGNEMMRYIQHCSIEYAKELDKTFPDLRRVIGYIVKTDISNNGSLRERSDSKGSDQLLPCDIYNKADTCNYPMLHLDANQDQRIHSCSLCYFSLGGLINLHRQTKCPLLNIIKK